MGYHASMRVLTWNGKTIPPELRKLPPGKYAVESVDLGPRLTAREEAGLEAAQEKPRVIVDSPEERDDLRSALSYEEIQCARYRQSC
jgi:hypothetical protein